MRKKTEAQKEFRDMILQQVKEGKVVFMTIEGPMVADLEEIIKQPTEGLLYDLNRDKATVITQIDNPKWVNDFAVALVIEKLKGNWEKAAAELAQLRADAEFMAHVWKGGLSSVIDPEGVDFVANRILESAHPADEPEG